MKNPSQQIADLIDEIVTHKVDVVTDSDWFQMLIEQAVLKVLREQQTDEENYSNDHKKKQQTC